MFPLASGVPVWCLVFIWLYTGWPGVVSAIRHGYNDNGMGPGHIAGVCRSGHMRAVVCRSGGPRGQWLRVRDPALRGSPGVRRCALMCRVDDRGLGRFADCTGAWPDEPLVQMNRGGNRANRAMMYRILARGHQ